MTFSESKVILQPFVLFNAKYNTYVNKLVIIFEHDGHELVKVHSRQKCNYYFDNLNTIIMIIIIILNYHSLFFLL